MPRNIQLLKQIRSTVNAVCRQTDNPNHKVQLGIVDMYLNELMLQDEAPFYLDYLARGRALLLEGAALASRRDTASMDAAPHRHLDTDSRIEAINREINALNAALVSVVQALQENRSTAEKDFLQRLTAWESSLYLRRLHQVNSEHRQQPREITAESLQNYLRDTFPRCANLQVTHFVTLEGGISKKTILFETDPAIDGIRSMVLRAEQPSKLLYFGGSDIDREFYMIALMHRLSMPVPQALWLEEDAGKLGMRFLVTTKAEGSTFYSGLATLGGSEKPSQTILDSLMQVLFRLHALTPDAGDALVQQSHLQEWMHCRTIRDVDLHYAGVFLPNLIARSGIAMTPQLLRGMRWLEANAPDCNEPPVIVHVDYAFNNILFEDGRLSAVLDWETSRLGDPADDIQWTQNRLGVYSMADFLALYEKATGRRVSEYRLAYSRVQLCVVSIAHGLIALRAIDTDDHSPLHSGVMGLKYMPLFSGNLGELIAKAEAVRNR
jgi:aminoglycoside phosphotransferase (APT) family kinase protein